MPHDGHDDHTEPPGDIALRVKALESLLVDKGLVDPAALDEIVETYETKIGPQRGAKVVARAWVDEGFKQRLLDDANTAVGEVGVNPGRLERLEIVFDEPGVHNVVCCTLCSCYPWTLLGLPPGWYKSPEYRSRIVREPRAVLAEMGLELDEETTINVWDSSSEVRYLVVPERPAGSEGLDEEELAALVTRDSMIGVARPIDGPGAR